MAYMNKVFVSFDGDNDIRYYNLMRAWKQNDNISFNFINAHDINTARDDSLEDTIKQRLRERLRNAKVFVPLIGNRTKYLYKFVRWEMEQALNLGLPIIGVNINGLKQKDANLCPPVIRDELAIYVSFNAAILQYALEHWPGRHTELCRENKTGSYYYEKKVYLGLGL